MKFGIAFWKENLFLIGIVYAILALAVFPKWTVDDAFITYRYAQNLAEHGELTWNVGEEPIEGYTGIALPLIIALFIKVGVSPIMTGKILGVTFYFLSVWWLYLILSKLRLRGFLRSLILLLYLTSPIMFSHTWSGLETIPYTALLLAGINQSLAVISAEAPKKSQVRLLFLTMLTVCLVRPEATVLAFTLILGLLAIALKFDRKNLREGGINALLFFIIPGLLYFIWRWNYYGYFLPNTFYAKGSSQFFVKGSVFSFAVFTILFCLLPFLMALISNLGTIRNAKTYWQDNFDAVTKTKILYLGIAVALFCVIIILKYFQSRLLMNFEARFYAPFYPIFLIFVAIFTNIGFSTLSDILKTKPVRFRVITVLLLLAFASQILINYQRLGKYIYLRWGYQKLVEECMLPLGEYLKDNLPQKEWLAVIYDTGAVPYYSGLPTLDFSRLNNEFLAHQHLSMKETADYFYSFNPGAVVISSCEWEKLQNVWYYGDEAGAITSDPRFSVYSLVKKYRTSVPLDNPSSTYFEFLFVRRDLLTVP